MIIVLNGPLGIGKSTLAELLMEHLDRCVMLDGDYIVAVNPPPADEIAYLHDTLALLVAHHRRAGYVHFVINHLWVTPAALDHLYRRLRTDHPETEIRTFLLTLSLDANLARVAARQGARAIDETEFERVTLVAERQALYETHASLGEPFDVSDSPDTLVARLLVLLGQSTEQLGRV